ncbi:MAG TPA: rhodanese-like domain-containing protein [Anaerolineae bacterium]|nr:rhodanese-like domain-containing protein [Anaerolineae bacterium]HMR63881.1 rhodanese-like domain-containing protein [Anaerolineae bacterium]
MKSFIWLVSFILISVLTACGSQPAEPPAQAAVDLGQLPDEIDVTTAAALQQNSEVLMLDVREEWEYAEGHIPAITHIPMGEIPNRLSEIPKDKTLIVTCRSGNRSGQITEFLRQNGYDKVHNMQGGIIAWQQAGLEVER